MKSYFEMLETSNPNPRAVYLSADPASLNSPSPGLSILVASMLKHQWNTDAITSTAGVRLL